MTSQVSLQNGNKKAPNLGAFVLFSPLGRGVARRPFSWITTFATTTGNSSGTDCTCRGYTVAPAAEGVADQVDDLKDVIEFLDGKMVFHTGQKLPAAVLTSSMYSESAAGLLLRLS